MTTIVGTIDELIDFLKKQKEAGYKYAITALYPTGGWGAPSKRKNYYSVGFAVAGDIFNQSDLNNLMNSVGFAVFLFKDTDRFSDKIKAHFEGGGGA